LALHEAPRDKATQRFPHCGAADAEGLAELQLGRHLFARPQTAGQNLAAQLRQQRVCQGNSPERVDSHGLFV